MPQTDGASADDPLVPASDIRSHRRNRWSRVAFAGLIVLGLAIAGVPMRAHEQVLDQRGVQARAVVVSTDYQRRLPDEVDVEYDVDGSRYGASLTVGSAGDFAVGETISIEYDPGDPGHARPLEGWSPTYQTLWLYAAFGAPVAIWVAWYTRRQLGRDVGAATSGRGQRMEAAPYRRRRWLGLERIHLVGLWTEGSDRQGPPPLSVRVESGKDITEPATVTVVGAATPGGRVVLRTNDETVWTTGSVKEGIDPRAARLDAR